MSTRKYQGINIKLYNKKQFQFPNKPIPKRNQKEKEKKEQAQAMSQVQNQLPIHYNSK